MFREVLFVFGRLRVGWIGLIGAVSTVLVFGGLALGLLVGWLWNLVVGSPIVPGHDILGGRIDISIVLVLPIVWIALTTLKGRAFLSASDARYLQEYWTERHWQMWHSEGQYSISVAIFLLSLFGCVTLLCVGAWVVTVLFL